MATIEEEDRLFAVRLANRFENPIEADARRCQVPALRVVARQVILIVYRKAVPREKEDERVGTSKAGDRGFET